MKNEKQNPHNQYAGLYVLAILETIISVKYVDLEAIEIFIRISFIIALGFLVHFRQTNLAKWVSIGIFILCCSSVIGFYDKIVKEETEITRNNILSSKEKPSSLDLSSCKDSPIYYSCVKELKNSHKEYVAIITENNKSKDLQVLDPNVDVPFSKLVNVFLYALLASVFSFAGIHAANRDVSKEQKEPVQESEQKKVKTEMSFELIEQIRTLEKLDWSQEKIADHFGWNRNTLKRAVERFEQENKKSEPLKLIKGKIA